MIARPQTIIALAVPLLAGATCRGTPTPQDRQAAAVHYDLGIQYQGQANVRGALVEYQKALEFDPDFEKALNALALLQHMSFGEHEKAIPNYKRALELKPDFSDAAVNLGNVYLDLGRYDEAIPLYERALTDMTYPTPYLPENNLGWALYKKGQVSDGLQHIRTALVHNPKFCLGYKNLGLIFADQKDATRSREAFRHYAAHCPAHCDAHYRLGKAHLTAGDSVAARASFTECARVGDANDCGSECKKLLDLMR